MDICSECNGIWLDYGEFEEIKKNQIDSPLKNNKLNYSSKYEHVAAVYELINSIKTSAYNDNLKKDSNTFKIAVNIDNRTKEDIMNAKIPADSYSWKGKINLLISGFSQQSIVSIDEIIKAIEILPDNHLQGLNIKGYLL